MEQNRIIEILIEKVKMEYADDVAAVVAYGKQDETYAGCYIIAANQRGKELSGAFLIREHGVQISCFTFDELTQLGTGDRRDVYLLLDGEALYVRSEEDKAVFEAIRERTANCDKIDLWLIRLLFDCKEMYFTFYEQEADAAQIAAALFQTISCALLMHGGSYKKGGWENVVEQVLALEQVPECYLQVVEQLHKTADPAILKNLFRKLIVQTGALILPKQQPKETLLPAKAAYAGVYEKAKIYYEKIIEACFAKKAQTALLYTADLQQMLEDAAARADKAPALKNLFDLYYSKDLASFAVSLYSHEASLIGFLLGLGIEFRQYPNVERFEEVMLYKEVIQAAEEV